MVKQTIAVALGTGLLVVPIVSLAATQLLVENKCNTCHSISSAGIEQKNKAMKAPDLSGIGKYHDAEYFKAYLKKEVAHEPHEGSQSTKKHPTVAKATGDELDKIAQELVNLK